MSEHESKIGISYETITITKSRIDKGLLAVPVSLLDRFPTQKQKITIYFDDEDASEQKSFLPYNTSAKECRIGGLSKWFAKNQIEDQDEIMVDFIVGLTHFAPNCSKITFFEKNVIFINS